MTRLLSVACSLFMAGLLFGCEVKGTIRSYVLNQGQHEVVLRSFREGTEVMRDRWTLPSGSKTLVMADIADGGMCYCLFLAYRLDSIVVVIGDRQAIHYSYNNPGNNPKALPIDHPRNFFNRDNWQLHVLKDRRNRYDADYTYTFTEQDYLDAN